MMHEQRFLLLWLGIQMIALVVTPPNGGEAKTDISLKKQCV
jgi:hypothetical protein